MRATYACSRGLGGEAKVDYSGDEGRIRGDVLFAVLRPERLRFDVSSPFGVVLSTLTSNGRRFASYDLEHREFLHGPATACNVARFTGVPVPPHVLVPLLAGEAPVLVHAEDRATIAWESGSYVLRIEGDHGAREEIVLEPRPDDWELPWQRQRIRVTGVRVEQRGVELYTVELRHHRPARTAKPRKDPDGLDPVVSPTGPPCDAEVPRGVKVEVPTKGQDVIFQYEQVAHNPPILAEAFTQPVPGGVKMRYADCGN